MMGKLTVMQIRRLKPGKRVRRLGDGGGLWLEVMPSGTMRWRFRYRRPGSGKETMITLGSWPDMSLRAARERRDVLRGELARGVDPGRNQRRGDSEPEIQEGTGVSFEAVAREWAARRLRNVSEDYRDAIMSRFERTVFPWIGRKPVADLQPVEILKVVRRIEERGYLDIARRTLQHIGQVIRYAIATGRATADPTPALREALPPPPVRHMPAPTDPGRVGEILRALDAFKGTPVVAAAVRILPYVFTRPGELRMARWEQISFEEAEWRYTTGKTGTGHLVPLSRQVLAILKELRPLTGDLPGGWVFPGARSSTRPMSDMAINAAYRRMGIDTREELTGHGWRAVARTLLHERLEYPPEVIEHQLAHQVPDNLGRAYNRTRFLDQRKVMMQEWADYLDELREG